MSLPILSASSPTTVPAIIYDKWWIQSITINAPNPNNDAYANVVLVKFATTEDGTAIMSNEITTLEMNSLLSGAASDPELASVIVGLMNYIMKIGQQQGIITSTEASNPQP